MDDILTYPDNLVVHLERFYRSYKAFTTEEPGKYKLIYGLSDKDSIIDIRIVTDRELKQTLVDACINGYDLKLNLVFKKNLYNLAKELADERERMLEEEKEKEMFENAKSEVEDCKFN